MTQDCKPVPQNVQNLIGNRYGRLVVIGYAGKKRDKHYWLCRCDCGNERAAEKNNLKSGNTQSCGCFRKEEIVKRLTKHGASRDGQPTRGYIAYHNMKKRCCDPDSEHYKSYGGRGITICARWLESFENFIRDMGEPPPGYTIERINNNGNYEPNNCKWIPAREQTRNTSRTRMITALGETKPLWQWSLESGINWKCLWWRIQRGWSPERAITTPVKK